MAMVHEGDESSKPNLATNTNSRCFTWGKDDGIISRKRN